MGLLRPGDKLSRGLSASNFVMLSIDGARELRDMLTMALDERTAAAADEVRAEYAAKHNGAKPVTAAQFAIDNLNVIVYDDDTDPAQVAETMARRTIADALETVASIRKDQSVPKGVNLN